MPHDTEVADHVWRGGWIFEENVRPFCESLARQVGYDFDGSDWQAVEHALPGTDDELPADQWYRYPIVGRPRVDVRLARAVGGSVVSVHLLGTADEVLRTRVDVLSDIMTTYSVARS